MWEVFEILLKKNGVTAADVSKATGVRQSTLSNWKKRNNLLTGSNAKKIADYFGVSVDYLMTGREYYTNDETAEVAQELFDQPGMRILFDAASGADPEALRLAAEMLNKMKKTNPDG